METKSRIRRSRYRPPEQGKKASDAEKRYGQAPGNTADPLGLKLNVYDPGRRKKPGSTQKAKRTARLKRAHRHRRQLYIRRIIAASLGVLLLVLLTAGGHMLLKRRNRQNG